MIVAWILNDDNRLRQIAYWINSVIWYSSLFILFLVIFILLEECWSHSVVITTLPGCLSIIIKNSIEIQFDKLDTPFNLCVPLFTKFVSLMIKLVCFIKFSVLKCYLEIFIIITRVTRTDTDTQTQAKQQKCYIIVVELVGSLFGFLMTVKFLKLSWKLENRGDSVSYKNPTKYFLQEHLNFN